MILDVDQEIGEDLRLGSADEAAFEDSGEVLQQRRPSNADRFEPLGELHGDAGDVDVAGLPVLRVADLVLDDHDPSAWVDDDRVEHLCPIGCLDDRFLAERRARSQVHGDERQRLGLLVLLQGDRPSLGCEGGRWQLVEMLRQSDMGKPALVRERRELQHDEQRARVSWFSCPGGRFSNGWKKLSRSGSTCRDPPTSV